jgi:Bacterial SH3 domain
MISIYKSLVRLLGMLAIAAATMAAPVLAQEQGPPRPPENTPLPPTPPAHDQKSTVPPQAQTANAPLPPAPPEHTGTIRRSAPRFALALANVNLRNGPSTATEIIATIPGGSTVRITGCDAEWCAASFAGRSGFVIARALDTGGPGPVRRYGGPPPGYRGQVVEVEPPIVYGPPPPVVIYGPRYYPYYEPRYYYYGRGWRRHW